MTEMPNDNDRTLAGMLLAHNDDRDAAGSDDESDKNATRMLLTVMMTEMLLTVMMTGMLLT